MTEQPEQPVEQPTDEEREPVERQDVADAVEQQADADNADVVEQAPEPAQQPRQEPPVL